MTTGHSKYRPEVDGLRALAVVPVVLFHAGLRGFSGGYVGVDIFFVISGYLITQIVIGELQSQNFSLARFYERRARRILPALFSVMLACVPFAWAWMAPAQLMGFAESMVAVSLFVSNVFFSRRNGYFDEGVDENPLLHTWSLGVEEQFYLFYPLFLLVFWRIGIKRLIWLILVIAVCSLGWAEWQSQNDSISNFYLAPSRAWELLLGALLTLLTISTSLLQRVRKALGNILAGVGLLMIICAIVIYDKATPFPSLHALVPTVGTVLVLAFAHGETIAAKVLSLKVISGIGLVSYSAYLWHQPLFAFARILTLGNVSQSLFLCLTAVNFGLAYLTWRFVETPFRGQARLSRASVFRLSVAGSLFFIAFGLWRYYVDKDNRLSYVNRANYGLSVKCDFVGAFRPRAECVTSKSPKVMVWGDSYAMHIVPGLMASDARMELVQATASVCGPLFGVAAITTRSRIITQQSAENCKKFNDSVLDYLTKQTSVELVVISSPFVQIVDGEDYDLLTGGGRIRASVRAGTALMQQTIGTLRQIRKKVVIVAPPPIGEFNLGNCTERLLLRKPIFGPARSCEIDRRTYLQKRGDVLEFLREVESAAHVSVIRFDDLLCNRDICTTSIHGIPVYRDQGHFSYSGVEYLGRQMSLATNVQRLGR